jgi:hypothetical protein
LTNKIKTYLAGPINHKNPEDFAYCKKWREDIAFELEAMNIECLDPLKKAGGDSISFELRTSLKTASKEGDLETINKIVGTVIIPSDLKMVVQADFITLYLPKRISENFDFNYIRSISDDKFEMERYIKENIYEICGTYGEATVAKYLGTPVYIVTDRDNTNIPEWLTGCCKDVFNSWDAFLLHIFNEYHSTVVK